jgi:hypothetical protein
MASFTDIVDRHQQLYPNSCPSMAVELVLKLHGMAGGGYRKIQDSYQNANIGYGPFRNRRIRQLYFYERGFEPPFFGLGPLLETELNGGRFPIISLWSGEERKGDVRYISFHEWVVIRQVGLDFHAVSKHFRRTIHCSVVDALSKSPHTNLLCYHRG